MGQYFAAVNRDRKESCGMGPAKIGAIVSSAGGSVLAYLQVSGPQDGTTFTRGMEDDEDLREHAHERYSEFEESKQQYYTDDDGEIDEDRLVTVVEAGREFAEANEYAGRWAGDDVAVVGDYSDETVEVNGEEVSLYKASAGVVTKVRKTQDTDGNDPETETIYWSGEYTQDELDERSLSYKRFELVGVYDTGWTDITDEVRAEAEHRVGETAIGMGDR